MRKKIMMGLIAIIATSAMFFGCVKEETSLLEVKTPIWNKIDLEVVKVKREISYMYDVYYKRKIPFYKGNMPLRFKVAYPPVLVNFINYFIYQGSFIAGAQTYTYDKNGNLIAEDRFTNLQLRKACQ